MFMKKVKKILLAGGIGLTLGMSWLTPGPHSRRTALAEAGRAVVRMVAEKADSVLG